MAPVVPSTQAVLATCVARRRWPCMCKWRSMREERMRHWCMLGITVMDISKEVGFSCYTRKLLMFCKLISCVISSRPCKKWLIKNNATLKANQLFIITKFVFPFRDVTQVVLKMSSQQMHPTDDLIFLTGSLNNQGLIRNIHITFLNIRINDTS